MTRCDAVVVRHELPKDAEAITFVTKEAFASAEYSSGTEQLIIKALREAEQLTVSLVAELFGTVIGHVAVSPVTVSDGATHWYGLGPVSVLSTHQRIGVGSRLIMAALNRLRSSNAHGCVVLGEPGYYSRFGFSTHPLLALPNVPAEYFQALSFSGPVPSGTVAYHEAFHVPG